MSDARAAALSVEDAKLQGDAEFPYTFYMSQMQPTELVGGSVKIVDSSNFNISKSIAAAEVTVAPGGIRCAIPSSRDIRKF